jgi:hypothetical protein
MTTLNSRTPVTVTKEITISKKAKNEHNQNEQRARQMRIDARIEASGNRRVGRRGARCMA